MNTSFLTSLSEQEFKVFLKTALQEILDEQRSQSKPTLPDILNIREAAAFLKLKITTIYEKTSCKIIPHFKKGNKLYFNREELEAWIKTGKVNTKQEQESKAASYLLGLKQLVKRRRNNNQ